MGYLERGCYFIRTDDGDGRIRYGAQMLLPLPIALLAPDMAGLPVAEYPPNMVKKALVGNGHAQKQQVAMMVGTLLPGLGAVSEDESDALAVAICHLNRADLLAAMRAHRLADGPHMVMHRWRNVSVLANAIRHEVSLTVHPGIGYDIIHEHPNCDGAALGRASYHDLLVIAESIQNSDQVHVHALQLELDLGAAPGSWSQIAAKIVGRTGQVVAIDLQEIEPLPGVTVRRILDHDQVVFLGNRQDRVQVRHQGPHPDPVPDAPQWHDRLHDRP